MKRFTFALIGLFSSVSSVVYAQQKLVVESVGFSRELPSLINVQKDGKLYLYNLESGLLLDKIENQSGGLNVFIKDGMYGVLRKDGKLLVPVEYDEIKLETDYDGQWHEGINYNYKYIVLTQNGKKGVADENGKIIIPVHYQDVKIINKKVISISENNRWGWVSAEDGHVLHIPEYEEVKTCYNDGFVMVSRNDKEGIAKVDGEVVIPLAYEYIGIIEMENYLLFKVYKDQKAIILDNSGNILFSGHQQYEPLKGSDYLMFRENDLWGIADIPEKKIIIPAQFEEITDFLRGHAIAKKGGKYGIIQQNGKTLLDFIYDKVDFMNAAGNYKMSGISAPPTPPVLQYKISDEVLLKRKHDEEIDKHPFIISVKKDKQTGILDWQGKTVIPIGKYSWIEPHYANGKTYYKVSNGKHIGLLDEAGAELLPLQYLPEHHYQFSSKNAEPHYEITERFICVSTGKDSGRYEAKIGLYDLEKRKMLLEPTEQHIDFLNHRFIKIISKKENYETTVWLYDIEKNEFTKFPTYVYDIHLINDRFLLLEREDKLYELTDLKGNSFYQNSNWSSNNRRFQLKFPEYRDLHPGDFYSGLKKIISTEGNLFIDENGKEIRFDGIDFVDAFYEGYAVAAVKNKHADNNRNNDYLYGVIDISGKVAVPFDFNGIYTMGTQADLLVFHNSVDKKAVVNRKGKMLVAPQYDNIDYLNTHDHAYFSVKKNGKYGIIDTLGNTIVPTEYDDIDQSKEGENAPWPLLVKKEDWYYFLDRKGNPYPLKAKQKN